MQWCIDNFFLFFFLPFWQLYQMLRQYLKGKVICECTFLNVKCRFYFLVSICTIMHRISTQTNTACSHIFGSVDYTDTNYSIIRLACYWSWCWYIATKTIYWHMDTISLTVVAQIYMQPAHFMLQMLSRSMYLGFTASVTLIYRNEMVMYRKFN